MNPLGWCPMFIIRFTPKVPDRTPASPLQPVYPVRFSILGVGGVLYLSTLLPLLIINRELHQHTLGSTKPLSRDLKNPNCRCIYRLVGNSDICHFSEKHHIFPQDDKVHVVRPVLGRYCLRYSSQFGQMSALLSNETYLRLSSNCMYLLYMRCYIYMIRVYLRYVPRCPISDARKKRDGVHIPRYPSNKRS